MEEAVIRHYPAILQDDAYLAERPIGMAYEKAAGYEIILHSAGFREIQVVQESMTFVSTDQEEWWRQMLHIGWDEIMEGVERREPGRLQRIKQAILDDLQGYQQADGLHFDKEVFLIRSVK